MNFTILIGSWVQSYEIIPNPELRKSIFGIQNLELEIGNRTSNLIKCLRQIVDDVVDMLCANAQTDGRWRDMLFGQFLGREL